MKRNKVSAYLAKIGRKGAKGRAKKLTPEQRSQIAKKAAAARWKDHQKPK